MSTKTANPRRRAHRSRQSNSDEEPISYVHHPSFGLPSAERRLWGPDRPEIPVAPYALLHDMPDRKGPSSTQRTVLTREDERMLFLRYNYARYRLWRLQRRRGGTAQRRRAEWVKWRQRADGVRTKLAHANLPLVPSMLSRTRFSGIERSEMLSEGYLAVLRSIDKFDVSRGVKFSSYACRSILAAFYHLMRKMRTRRKYIAVSFDPQMQESDEPQRRHETVHQEALDTLRALMDGDRANLTQTERRIIRYRYPMAPQRRRTLAQVGKILGVSDERVRQMERTGLLKLRLAFQQEQVA